MFSLEVFSISNQYFKTFWLYYCMRETNRIVSNVCKKALVCETINLLATNNDRCKSACWPHASEHFWKPRNYSRPKKYSLQSAIKEGSFSVWFKILLAWSAEGNIESVLNDFSESEGTWCNSRTDHFPWVKVFPILLAAHCILSSAGTFWSHAEANVRKTGSSTCVSVKHE